MVDQLNFQSVSDRLPPYNTEAEESILGGIMLDPEAINRVSDRLQPEAFYHPAHQDIYKAALKLHTSGQPTDLISVATWLGDRGLLEKIGNTSKLAALVDRTVSAVNIDLYAALVVEKYLRRQLIKVGNEIVQLGYDTATELTTTLDQAEQKLFSVTQDRIQKGLVPISDTLIHTFEELEQRNQGTAFLPGLICDFYDLDAMTGGFQRSDLIIIAGRPSMGKTSFAINVAQNIAAAHKLPVAVFSLEMSKEQLVQRMLASETKIESNRLRSGRISQNEWEPLSRAINVLSELPIFIDDTANITVMEMRSQARRLQAEHGGVLGLILIDYLQLMEGSGSDNRVQELSRITRSLKGLARELNVPVIALSQLSRGVEARTNKRPMMSDLRESGCLTGDSLITLADSGVQVPIRDLVGKSGFAVWALNEATMQLERAVVSHAFSTGIKPVFQLKTRLGRTIRATGNHKFRTIQGWQRLDELKKGDRIALPRSIPSSSLQLMSNTELGLLGHLIGDGCTLPQHAIQYTTREEDLASVVTSLAVEVFGELVQPRIVRERGWYQVWVTGKPDLEKFVEMIGAVGSYKQQSLQDVAKYIEARSANTNRDVIPRDIWKVYAVPAMQESGLTIRQMQSQLGVAHCGTALYKQNLSRERASRLALVVKSDEIERLSNSDIYWDEVVAVEADGEAEVYDLTVPIFHNFIANNIVVHNSIEQDADLIMMLYRDSYYNPDSPDRDQTELILAKHRNGPTGTVKLKFESEHTKFLNIYYPNREVK